MNIITEKEIISELKAGLQNPNRTALVLYENTQINYGFDDKPNFEYCKQHNLAFVDIGRRGGAFVVNAGDVGLGHVAKGLNNDFGELLYSAFLKFLLSKGLNAIATENDILINGYKVFGWASHYYKDYDATFITIHFSMSVDLDMIKSVCIKPMHKVPKGLNDFGIYREDIIQLIENVVTKYMQLNNIVQ